MNLDMAVWNTILSFMSGLILLLIKSQWDEVKRMQILLNKTREEVARDYVTRTDVHNDINRVLDRFDRLENKLDAYIKEQRHASEKS